MYVKGLLHAKQHLTDGFVSDSALALVGIGCKSPQKIAKHLVAIGLWEAVEGGYTVGYDRWARHQTTAEEVSRIRAETAKRVAEHRNKKRKCNSVTPPDVTHCYTPHVTEGVTGHQCNSTPSPSPEYQEKLVSRYKPVRDSGLGCSPPPDDSPPIPEISPVALSDDPISLTLSKFKSTSAEPESEADLRRRLLRAQAGGRLTEAENLKDSLRKLGAAV